MTTLIWGSQNQVGAGIQVPPNSGKLLKRWGVTQRFANYVVQPAKMNFRRWEDGTLIGVTDTSPEFTERYGAPYFVVHRAHLHHALYEQASALGVQTRLNSKIDSYDADTATIVTSDGSVFGGDLIVAADGNGLPICIIVKLLTFAKQQELNLKLAPWSHPADVAYPAQPASLYIVRLWTLRK